MDCVLRVQHEHCVPSNRLALTSLSRNDVPTAYCHGGAMNQDRQSSLMVPPRTESTARLALLSVNQGLRLTIQSCANLFLIAVIFCNFIRKL